MKQLIINADDFGLTAGINRGIVEAHQHGLVTSTTLMANGEAFEDALRRARAVPSLGVGVHLSLIGGRPILPASQVPTLLNRDGQFPPTLTDFSRRLFTGKIKFKEVERELRAQIQRVRDAGFQPTHLDSHKHVHLHPRIFRTVARLCWDFGIAGVRKPFEEPADSFFKVRRSERSLLPSIKQRMMRSGVAVFERPWNRVARQFSVRTPDHFVGFAWTGAMTEAYLIQVLEGLGEGVTELMCHPGWPDEALERVVTRLRAERERELQALLSPRLPLLLVQRNIRLCNFRNAQWSESHQEEEIWNAKKAAQVP